MYFARSCQFIYNSCSALAGPRLQNKLIQARYESQRRTLRFTRRASLSLWTAGVRLAVTAGTRKQLDEPLAEELGHPPYAGSCDERRRMSLPLSDEKRRHESLKLSRCSGRAQDDSPAAKRVPVQRIRSAIALPRARMARARSYPQSRFVKSLAHDRAKPLPCITHFTAIVVEL